MVAQDGRTAHECSAAHAFRDGLPRILQIQLRDLPGFAEARHQLLQLRPGNRANWINFAVAHHLNGNHELAVQVRLTAFPGEADLCSLVSCTLLGSRCGGMLKLE